MVSKRTAQPETHTREAGKMEELMDMECSIGLMEIVMRVGGKEDSSMVMPS